MGNRCEPFSRDLRCFVFLQIYLQNEVLGKITPNSFHSPPRLLFSQNRHDLIKNGNDKN